MISPASNLPCPFSNIPAARRLQRAGIALGLACAAFGAAAADSALPAYQAEKQVAGTLSSMGDASMAPLMDAWLAAFTARQPGIHRGRWENTGVDLMGGGLMFELVDMSPLGRELIPTETGPYAHQFAGDMMKTPLLVQVAKRGGKPTYIAVNKRPGSPLPQRTKEFIGFALSREGQDIVGRQSGFAPLAAAEAAAERTKLDGYLATLDPALPVYKPSVSVTGEISSVGSDGMKTLMDRWMREFRQQQPGVRKGERWEHYGTLNGFHALIVNEADIAPMGRELWPAEAASYEATHHLKAPLEIRVARGGFNTPQRTTAQAIWVHPSNPLQHLTVQQLAGLLGKQPTITRWGQLGLGGEWADRPVTIYMPPAVAPNSMSMQMMVLHGAAWNATAKEGSIADTAAAIARDPNAIGFGGFEEGGPGLKTVAVAEREGTPYLEGTGETASSGRYPLTRYMYIRMTRAPGQQLSPQLKEFLKYILSRDGQEPVLYSGYFPLTAAEVKEELAKLE